MLKFDRHIAQVYHLLTAAVDRHQADDCEDEDVAAKVHGDCKGEGRGRP